MNVLQQLRMDYEAATGGEWEAADKSVRTARERIPGAPAPNSYHGGICNCLGDGMQGKNNPVNVEARANAQHIVSAHNRMPLLLAVAEAAAAYVEAVRRERDLPEHLVTDAEFDEYEKVLLGIDAAQDALKAAVAPLMQEAGE